MSEQVLLQCQQLVRAFCCPATCMTTNAKALDVLINKAKGRMSGALMTVYTEDYDATSENPAPASMKLLEDLQGAVKQLEAILPLVKRLNDRKLSTGSGQTLLGMMADTEAADVGVKVPEALVQVALEMELDSAWESGNYLRMMDLLNKDWCGDEQVPQARRLHLGRIPSAEQASFQDKHVTKGLVNLMRADGNVDKVRTFVQAAQGNLQFLIATSGSASAGSESDIEKEIEDLSKLLWPMSATLTTENLVATKRKLENDRQLRLWRPLYLFKTGQEIMEAATSAINQRSEDARLESQLKQLRDKVTNLGSASGQVVISDSGDLTLISRIQRAEALSYVIFKTTIQILLKCYRLSGYQSTAYRLQATTELINSPWSIAKWKALGGQWA